ncbi:Transcription intermediary factor 1-beta [Holothuria leucospilota]|uniref:Transcription intermediary factor 1-beta n=1 Tax=Holothuria leucospilota TaxID=206669 RepID=A0A9Q1BTS6_HOLLE|nr:Transcription intermediary factor 1-beta [Holothuria leucospilota]
MKNLVEYVQIQQSLKSDEMRKCYGCSNHLRVTAYCFKCNDFLCEVCHNFHLTNRFLTDHQKHTLSLADVESKNITIEKLASMRDAPRCNTHPEKISELYCESCNYIPVCIACMFGEHKGHDLHEVRALAKSKRESLAQKVKCLEKLDADYKLTTPGQAKEILISNVASEKEKVIKMCADEVHKAKAKLHDTTEKQKKIKQEKQNREKQVFDSLQAEMEKELQGVKKKYEEIFNVKKNEINNAFHARETIVENEIARLTSKLERFYGDEKVLLESIEMQLKKNSEEIDAVSEHFDNTKKRLKNLKVLASTIIASENDWTAVQCIPDIQSAADNLINELKDELPDLGTMTGVTINYKQFNFGKSIMTKISQQAEMKFTLNNSYHYVNGVTSCGDGNIVISGCPSEGKEAFIIVTNLNGKILHEKKIIADTPKPWHPCAFVSQNKVATVCGRNIICVYDLLHDSLVKKNISDIINSWPKDRYVRCVATDPVNSHILVGGYKSRDVYVFDDQLNYLHILTLPEMIKWPRDITFSDGHLLVCDSAGKTAYVTTMDGLQVKILSEFVKVSPSGDFEPWSICTDKNGMVYILWENWRTDQHYLAQYSHDGRQITAKKNLGDRARASTAVETPEGEKLLVATHSTQTVYRFGLQDDD